jgi:D-tyrosyl-tRNA(Tyr) deacylase
MKVVVQRVTEASCTVDNQLVSKIQNGYLLLVGLTHDDTINELEYIAKKIANLRVFEDENGKLNKSIKEMNYEILSISQFTLYGDASKGNRPSFTKAMRPEQAEPLYKKLTNILQETHNIPTKEGVFGAYMDIKLTNDGPVTIILESKEK